MKRNRPIELFETKPTDVTIVYFMDPLLQNLPSLVCIIWIHHDLALQWSYLKIPLWSTHLLQF